MQAKEMEHYLSLLGEELKEMGVQSPIQCLMIGGGYMITQVGNRLATEDVDVLVIEPDVYSELFRLLKAAIHYIADDASLSPKWFSTTIGDFLRLTGPLPALTLWRAFGPLHIYIPPADYILAHKIQAGREKDQDDIRALLELLQIRTRQTAQQIVDAYILERDEVQVSIIEETLDRFFGHL